MSEGAEKIRLDKWLWQARFFKTRSLATRVVGEGIRVNGGRTSKPSRAVGPGDVLTFMAGERARVIKILACGTRRGPAPEAQALYEDLSPPPPTKAPRAPGSEAEGRPTKKDRRALDRLRGQSLE